MKNGIIRRITALLLTMVCIITAMPEALLTTYADEIQALETEVLEEIQSGTEEAEYLEESENAKEETECTMEQSVTTETAEENQNIAKIETSTEEIKSTEQLETVTEKIESTEQTEIVTDNTENSGQSEISTEESGQLEESTQSEIDVQETETTEKEIISETETVLETEILSEAETESISEIIPETESVSENLGIMLLSDEGETDTTEITIDAAYTDENGIIYSYYAYEDGAANIYAMADYNGKDVAIPSVIDGYTVTQITAQLSYGAQLVSLTIPETVVSIGEYCFQIDGIGTLYYNATEAADIESAYGAPFVGAAIGNLVIGENVRVIPKRMFYQAGFLQEELVLDVETIGINAFSYAVFKTLTIADGVKYLYGDAFESADIEQLNYYSNAESVESASSSGVFHSADIYALSIGENVTTLADYLFALSYLRFKELTINVETIGTGTFYQAWTSYSNTGDYSVDLTIGEKVQFIGAEAFYNTAVSTLHFNANAETGASGNTKGAFYTADIGTLVISEQVEKIPDYLFSGTNVSIDTLELNVKEIGKYAFYNGPKITNLIIGECVEEIGIEAFEKGSFAKVVYEAVHANVGGQESISVGKSPFYSTVIADLQIGESVEIIPRCLFAGSKLNITELSFPDCLTEIGASAFYEASAKQINIGTLIIGENMTALGSDAFYNCTIGTLNYNAVDAVVSGAASASDTPFWAADVGTLAIGENVTQLPSYLFCGFNLTQDTLIFPDCLKRIGAYAISSRSLSPKSISIGTLLVGKNVEYIDKLAFCYLTFETVIVNAVEGDEAYKQLTFTSNGLPNCTNVQIHTGSDFYEFFTKRTSAGNVTSLCEDFETSYGETYYDSATKQFVTPVTDTCTVCGYEVESEQYEAAYTVTFLDYDETVLSTQYLHLNEDAQAPENPERTGYTFLGWDKEFTGITADLTVTAQYEIQTFSVVFKNKETILSEQTIEYGSNAVLPAEPTRSAEEWGTWKFVGWNGNYTNITKEEIITAEFEKVLNEYNIIFYDSKGSVLSEQTIAHGSSGIAPEAPEKEATAQYSYTFAGWSEDFSAVTEDMQIYPMYDSQLRSYKVTFLDADGNVLEIKDVLYGNVAELPQTPIKESDAAYDYVFTGWDSDLTQITQDIVTRPLYDSVIHTYNVVFKDGETVLSEQTIEYGNNAVVPAEPTRLEEEWGTWKFVGWNGNYTNITKEEIITAEFEKVFNEYNVIFYDGNGNILSEQTVIHGQSAIVPEAPIKEADAQYSYTFTGWSEDYTSVTSDLEIYPEYVSILRKYTVTFKDGELVLKEQEVEYGSDAELPAEPTRTEEEWGIWKFTGWLGNYLGITQNEVVQAVFEKVLNRYTVSFADAEGNVMDTQFVEHGKAAVPPEQPVKESDAQYAYTFAGWNGDIGNITKSVVFYPLYDKQIRSYFVVFKDGETVLSEQLIEYGNDAVLPENPTRLAEEWGTWKFVGWNGNYTNITKEEIITAKFEKVFNEYAVIFYDEKGNVLSEQTIMHGQSATVPDAPIKEADEQYSYTFSGWSEDCSIITSDMKIYPQYDSAVRSYKITFIDGDTVLSEQTIEYGGNAILPENPTRLAEEWGIWKFIGWNGNYTNITKEEIITAEFEKVFNKYAVIFYDEKGNVLSEQTITYGQSAIAPDIPEKEADAQYSYTFTGWSEDYTSITSDLEIYPEYISILRKYTVTFKDGELILKEQEVEYGNDAELPTEPTRAEEEWGIWKFTGWLGTYLGITQNEVVQAVFEKVLNRYTVSFADAEGNVMDTQFVEHGKAAVSLKQPVKESDAQYDYTFVGWNGDIGNITKSVVFYPVYDKQIRSYSVVFKDGENILSEQLIAYGSNAVLPENPTRSAEEWGTWKFVGWNGNYTNITKEEIITAEFEKVFNEYAVIFYDEKGNEISEQMVIYGQSAIVPDVPMKESDEQYSYTFTGWSEDYTSITSDLEIYPEYVSILQKYIVTFKDEELVLKEQEVEYGSDAELPEEPTRAEEEWGIWKFTGWLGNYLGITQNEVVQAEFEKVLNRYTVSFADANGNVIDTQYVEHGKAAVPPKQPFKESDTQYNYSFAGWNGDIGNITKSVVFYPVYDKQIRSYSVVFKDGETVLSEQTIEYGSDSVLPENPTRLAEEWGTWKFVGWNGNYTNITKEEVITAEFEKVFNIYIVIFEDGSGNVLSRQEVEHGQSAKAPENPKKEVDEQYRYIFSGWDKEFDSVIENMTISALYEKEEITKPAEPIPEVPTEPEENEPTPEPELPSESEEDEPTPNPENPSKPEESETEIESETPSEQEEEPQTEQDNLEETELTEAETEENTEADLIITEKERKSDVWCLFMALLIAAVLTGFILWLILLFSRRKIYGTVYGADGKAISGALIVLEGKKQKQIHTDKDGYYCFEGVKKRDHVLHIFDNEESLVLKMNIFMEETEADKVFIIMQSCCITVDTKQEHKKYTINVTI